MQRRKSQHFPTLPTNYVEFALVLLVTVLLAGYVFLRYSGTWSIGGDTTSFTWAIRLIIENGTLTADQARTYPNGYGYQALVVFLHHVTGMPLNTLQIYGAAFFIIWLILPAWLLYRELIENNYGATIATVLLFAQPELLFGIMRGTHEKFTRGLMLLCLYLIIRSLRSQHRPTQFAGLVMAFYCSTYAMIAFNNLMATSFIFAVGMSLILSWLMLSMLHRPPERHFITRRLSLVTVTCLVLSFIFIFYIYHPAQENLFLFKSTTEQTAALLLDVETTATNPYVTLDTGWINQRVYMILSLSNWLLLILSALIWLSWSIRMVFAKQQWQSVRELYLWSFYGAFAFQGALSILVDVSGAIAGNLQHRLFPTFTMLAIPLIVRWFFEKRRSFSKQSPLWYPVISVSIGVLAILSLLKATNEPTLSNNWLFFRPTEMNAIEWADTKLENRTLWIGYDGRLTTAFAVNYGATRTRAFITHKGVNGSQTSRTVLISDVIHSHSARLSIPLPVDMDDFIVFDNGDTQIYHQRPHTFYER